MVGCLQLNNQRMRGLGPIPCEFKTFHINEGVTSFQAWRMMMRLDPAKRDLLREEVSIEAFWEKWERTNGDMSQDEVSGAVEMMRKWRDGMGRAVSQPIRAEAQKYFGMDDGIEEGGFTSDPM